MFHRLIFIFLLLIVSSFSCNFNHCAVCFQSLMNTACRSTQNATRIKCFLRLHIVIKALNKKINIISSLLCWSITLLTFIQTLCHSSHCKFGACQKWEPAGRVGDFGNFLNGFIKSPRLTLLKNWLSAICLKKLWNTTFCPRSVWDKVLFQLRCDVSKVLKVGLHTFRFVSKIL